MESDGRFQRISATKSFFETALETGTFVEITVWCASCMVVDLGAHTTIRCPIPRTTKTARRIWPVEKGHMRTFFWSGRRQSSREADTPFYADDFEEGRLSTAHGSLLGHPKHPILVAGSHRPLLGFACLSLYNSRKSAPETSMRGKILHLVDQKE